MTPKQVRKLVVRKLGEDAEDVKVSCRRRQGKCAVVVTRRVERSSEVPTRLLMASASTWSAAADEASRLIGVPIW